MSDMEIKLKSPQELIDLLNRFKNAYPSEMSSAIYRAVLFNIMRPSIQECPIKFGALRASNFIDDPAVRDGNIAVSFGYTRSYGIYVHENLEAYHKPPTKAKFLEDPMRRAVPEIGNAIVEELLSIFRQEVGAG